MLEASPLICCVVYMCHPYSHSIVAGGLEEMS